MELDTSCASGCRRSRAALAVSNSLNAADLVAVVVSSDHQARVAEAVRQELERESGTRVLALENLRTPWMEEFYHDSSQPSRSSSNGSSIEGLRGRLCEIGGGESAIRRAVLLWQSVDAYVSKHPEHFTHLVRSLCDSLSRSAALKGSGACTLDRLVLVGGDALLDRLDQLAAATPEGVRFRYILVG